MCAWCWKDAEVLISKEENMYLDDLDCLDHLDLLGRVADFGDLANSS